MKHFPLSKLTCLLATLLSLELMTAQLVSASPAQAKVRGSNGRIVFGRFDPALGDFHIFTVKPNGTGEVQLLPGRAECPRWAPDGDRIQVCVFNAKGLLRPATLNPDGSEYTLLDNPDPTLNLACWAQSPGGTRLACESWDDVKPNRPAAIFTVRSSDGGGQVRVTTNPYGGHDIPGDYSPDGTRIVFGRNNPTLNQFALFVVNVDGSGLRQITAWQPDFGSASWSPDGKRIVFSLFLASTGHVDIFTAKADGTDLRQVTNTPQDEEFADWGTHSD